MDLNLVLSIAVLIIGFAFGDESIVSLSKRAVNGQPLEEPLPFLASIQMPDRSHFCTGALVAAEDGVYSVITAGHCFADKDPRMVNGHYYVRVNFLRLRELGQDDRSVVFKVNSVNVHSEFQVFENGQTAYDIAQLQLYPLPLTRRNLKYLRPISLNRSDIVYTPQNTEQPDWKDVIYKNGRVDDDVSFFDKLEFAGWGATQYHSNQVSNHAQQIDLYLSEFDECEKLLKLNKKIPSGSVFCAQGQRLRSDSCKGDSGGPLYVDQPNPVAVGLVSFGDGCGQITFGTLLLPANVPAVYTNLEYFHPWIAQNLDAMKNIAST
ncbi:hypothetical protein MP228_007447 [Amoeboaphelidium protococcarum]|nr:hypothetical protein MP228_007447 [Amoeboaphelidium protococcarum]